MESKIVLMSGLGMTGNGWELGALGMNVGKTISNESVARKASERRGTARGWEGLDESIEYRVRE